MSTPNPATAPAHPSAVAPAAGAAPAPTPAAPTGDGGQPAAPAAAPAAPAAPASGMMGAVPAAGAPAAPPQPAAPAAPAASPPMDYQAVLKAMPMPENIDGSIFSEADSNDLVALAKDAELNEKQLQIVRDTLLKQRVQDAADHKAQVQEWATSVTKDPELAGTNGEKLQATQANVERGFAQFGSPELKEFFDASGMGNHPMFVRLFNKIGGMIGGDNLAAGGAPTGQQGAQSPEAILYKDM